MFNQFEPNVKAIIKYIDLLNVKVNTSTVNDTLQNHPNWPSLLCISDSLNKWNIPNGVGKINSNVLNELPTPFIAYTTDRESPLAIVTNITGDIIEKRQGNYNKIVLEERKAFEQKWDGVFLISEPDSHSGEKNYEKNKQLKFFQELLPISALVITLVLTTVFLYKNISLSKATSQLITTGIFIQFIINILGLVVTTMLLWYEIDKNNPLLKKVCTGISKGNCNAILTGKTSKIFYWLSWSEIGFFYFSGATISLIFSSQTFLPIIAIFNVVAIPYPIFSIYYQWRVVKQWCLLCMIVQSILILGFINVITTGLLSSFFAINSTAFIFSLFIYALPVLVWYTLKPYILKLQEFKKNQREYLRIKYDFEIFDTLLKKQQLITVPVDGLGIDFGNPHAENSLIKVCNPFCGPCAKAHSKLEELVTENKNIRIKIIFMVPNREEASAYKPTAHLLAIAESKQKNNIKQALDDWYLAESKDYERFAIKYPMNGELKNQGSKMNEMYRWCEEMKVTETPTLFLNGYKLPETYDVTDLAILLAE